MTEKPSLDSLLEHAPPRHTAHELPSYRFIPGLHPHPTADPRGHSHGRSVPFEVAALDGGQWWASPGYLYGCDLYNRGFWWEAHEAWERIWHLAGRLSAERTALQGLIQLANAHLKLHMGRAEAVPRLQRSYAGHWARIAGRVDAGFMGLDFSALRMEADAYFDRCLARSGPVHDPAAYPFLRLAPAPESH